MILAFNEWGTPYLISILNLIATYAIKSTVSELLLLPSSKPNILL
jgi:hypothetical protein